MAGEERVQPRSGPLGAESGLRRAGSGGPRAPGRVALVHDWLNQAGGAEVVLEVLHERYPTAPVFTTVCDCQLSEISASWDIRVSWMDRLPAVHERFQRYLPLYPLAWQMTHIDGADLVISNKSGFCHGVNVGRAVHACYCLTPTRYVWRADEYVAHERVGPMARMGLRLLLPLLRRWDYNAAQKVDRFAAISTVVRDRITRYYDRTSTVIHPPVLFEDCRVAESVGDYYVVLARLAPYKRIDLAVRALTRLRRRLVVIGGGRDRERLERLAGPTIEFVGRLPRAEVVRLLSGCRAMLWPGEEDFGLAPVEAMASGRPVIARRAGGVLDTVVEGKTGLFFDRPEAGALAAAVERADEVQWEPLEIRRHAEGFGRAVFESRLQSFLEEALEAGKRGAYD